MKKLLILSNKLDMHADWVVDKLYSEVPAENVVRLNTEDLLTNSEFLFNGECLNFTIKDSNRCFEASEIASVWYRRPETALIPDAIHESNKAFVTGEIEQVIDALYYATAESSFWVNPRLKARMSANKIQQLRHAREIGFRVPKTLITSSPVAAKEFLRSNMPICIKRIGNGIIEKDGVELPFFTVLLNDDERLSYLDNVEVCPTFFQEYIDKLFDVRVVIVGEDIFAVEIHSQRDSLSKRDFRLVAPHLLEHKPHILPSDIASKLRRFMHYYDLQFSAFDLVVSNQHEYFFLENNPNGQWLWLEIHAGVPISQSITKLLSSKLFS